jgi:group II intron reverse transcriptase/maturase
VAVNRWERKEPAGVSQPKPFDIDRQLFTEAFARVREENISAGVDGVTVEAFAQRLDDNLYKLWNRMSSGTYFPSPVLAVEMPVEGGGARTLCMPTVADRIAQTVVLLMLEPQVERAFHPDSYAYRPGHSPAPAPASGRRQENSWVVDLEIRSIVGSIPWDTLMPVVAANLDYRLRWVLLYTRRWLEVPLQGLGATPAGADGAGRHGAVMSPLLANIFLHYAFDGWLARSFPAVQFKRSTEFVAVHCDSEPEARRVLAATRDRLSACGLDLNEDGTHIEYRNTGRRPGSHRPNRFSFLGHALRRASEDDIEPAP